MKAARSRMKGSERREQILVVARECFSEHGYSGTTTAMIARETGVTEPVLYRHFASKLVLFHAILEETLHVSLSHFAEITAGLESGADKLLAIVQDYPKFARKNRNLFNMVDRAVATDGGDKTRRMLADYYHGFEEALCAFVAEGQADGSIRKSIDPLVISSLLTMAGVGFGVLDGLDDPRYTRPDFPEKLASLIALILKPRA